jgi:signal transduction histidine kinase/CheY-like chemotaxis protein
MIPGIEEIARLSREFALVCDADGVVIWADGRATSTVGATPGVALAGLCVPGTGSKVRDLVKHALQASVEGWELSFVCNGATLTATFNATPHDGFALLVGHVAPSIYQTAIEGMEHAVADVVNLSRETARQKHEIARYASELESKNRELQDSNRGILSLHRELEDRALTLTHSAQVKSRVVSSVSHEFRTPLTSILGLTQLLVDGSDGSLNPEQQKQVRFIRSSAEELMTLVNDLLDLSKIESGTASLRLTTFPASEFVADLRGALKPLVAADSGVSLEFAVEGADFTFETDRAKLSQVMRNLISNAIKFTDKGYVRLCVRAEDDGRALLSVTDSGVGIAATDVDRVFEEFAQLDNPLQMRARGTGLGLPIAKRLAEILGGEIAVESTVGEGSTFTVTVPLVHPDAQEMQQVEQRSRQRDPSRAPVLVVEDDRRTLFVYERYLAMAGFQVIPARTIDAARQALERELPVAIVLDVVLEEENTWSFLSEVKRNPRTQHVPVLVVTVSEKGETARALGADEFWLKPVDQTRLLKKLQSLTQSSSPVKVLVVDDDERARYLVRKHLTGRPFELFEAGTGEEGVALAQRERPQVILLDFLLESMTAFDVLDELKSNPATRAIPVIIVTAHILDASAREKLSRTTEAIIAKQNLSRELAINRIRDALRRSGAETQL